MDFQLEICANSIRSAVAAQKGGAHRIELCDNMAEGGTTPSYGMISLCKKLLSIPIFPIIRPRGGDFLYTDEEFEVMKTDVIDCREMGCQGVVTGILKTDGSIDTQRCAELIALAKPMQVTFHRAFDRCNDLEKGLEDVIALGCERILTSGGETNAYDGIPVLKILSKAAGRIGIMAGAGINEKNIAEIATKTGIKQFHSTAKSGVSSMMQFSRSGKLSAADNLSPLLETDTAIVKKMIAALNLINFNVNQIDYP